MKKIVAALAVMVLMVLSGCTASPLQPVKDPPVTPVAEESEPAPEPEVVETVVVPDECLLALDQADYIIEISANTSDLMTEHLMSDSRIWDGLAVGDYLPMEQGALDLQQFTADIEANTLLLLASTYVENRDACRSASTSTG